jgi:hypothetical protein
LFIFIHIFVIISSSDLLTWACASPLPKEDIFICFNNQDAIDQGWAPALMTAAASQQLHKIGLTKTSTLIRAALELDPASFTSNLGSCFVERTRDVQEALKSLLGALGQSTTQQQQNNLRDYQARIQIELQKQISVFGDPISPFSAAPQVPDSSTFGNLKTYDQSEKQFFDACYKGDVVLANKLLGESFIDVDAKDMNYRNQTFLYAACRGPNCQPAIVELLLRHRASTRIPSGQTQSLPVHALVINFVDCTHQANPSFIPQTKFDEYFGRLAAIVQLLKMYHADFNSMNAYGHSAYSELKHEPAENYLPARSHIKFTNFLNLIQDSSARQLHVEALVPDQVTGPMYDAELQAAYEFLRKNPKLPEHTAQTISELVWSEKSINWTPILGRTAKLEEQAGCGLLKFVDHAMLFKGATLELKLRENQKTPLSLVLCNWPQDCTTNFEQPRVTWQLLRPFQSPKAEDAAHKFITRGSVVLADCASQNLSRSWVPIEEELFVQQLKQMSTSINVGQHKYKLSATWVIEPDASDALGPGPLTGHRIRWVPDCSISSEEDAEMDTGGCDDQVKWAADQMHYQKSLMPISADPEIIRSSISSAQMHVPASITISEVVNARLPPPVALQPQQQLSKPLPPGWFQQVDPHGRTYYYHPNSSTSSWDFPAPPPDARREQWFTASSFEAIPELVFDRRNPQSSAKVHLTARTFCDENGVRQVTNLPAKFYSNNESVARIEDFQFLRVMGPGEATIYAYQEGNQVFKPTSDWNTPNSIRAVRVVELCEFDVAAPETRLKAGYPILYTSLQTLLNLGPQHLTWSKDLKKVTIVATYEKGAILTQIWESILGAHRVIEHFQKKGVESLEKARKSLFDIINRDSPKIPLESPTEGKTEKNVILQDIKEFLQLLRSECDAEIERFVKEVDAVVEAQVYGWMQLILNDSAKPGFMQHFEPQIAGLLRSSTRRTDSFKPTMTVDVLRTFFDKKIENNLQGKSKSFESCRNAFEQFRSGILQRVSQPNAPFLLSTMIQDFMIHLVSAGRGLAFYKESAIEMLDLVMRNDVISVTTATGSGKSTLMPLLLIAANIGIKRVAVTQPRRFAAQSIYQTISHYHGHSIVGFAMAGESVNPMAPIVYITDGLLRTQLNLDKDFAAFDCIIIDEVHERSENIDACVALLAKMKELKLKMPKVILSSATLDDKVIKPFTDAGCRHGKCSTQVNSPFARTLHYPDRRCGNPSCIICQQLSASTFPLTMIKFVKKHQAQFLGSGGGQMLVFMPSTQDVISAVADLGELNITAYPLFAGQDGKTQSDSLSHGEIFISTNIAETSLTFPKLKVVIDLGKVQRPRLIDENGKVLPAPLMETVDASKATLSQRLGRVGRVCDGHYIALYPWSSQSSRPEHIKAGLELFPSDSVCFSLAKQLRWPQPMSFSFPGRSIQVAPLDPDFITFPELGNKMMADAFHASLRLGCSEDILLIASFMMKIPPKSQNLVISSGQKLLPAAAAGQALPNGDISVILEIMRRINSSVPPSTPHKPVTGKIARDAIVSWCSKHGLDAYSSALFRAFLEFQKMQAFFIPQRPPHGSDHSKSHPLFARIPFNPPKKSFDALGKQWNGFPFGRKHIDGSPDMKCKENYEIRRLVRGSSMDNVVQALSFGYPNNFYVHCAELDGPLNSYSRIADCGDGGDGPGEVMKTYYTLHTKSSLAKSDKEKFTVLFAMSSMMFGAEMQDVLEPFRLGALSVAEPCTIQVLPDRGQIVRRIALCQGDQVPGASDVTIGGRKYAELKGSPRSVIDAELKHRKSPQLRVQEKIKLVEPTIKDKHFQDQHTAKLEQLKEAKDKSVFKPLTYMWKNLYNTKLEIHVGNIQDLHINFTGRRQQLAVLKKHLEFWGWQFQQCPTLKFEAEGTPFANPCDE